VQAGFDVTVFALYNEGLKKQEKIGGFKVERIHLVTRKLLLKKVTNWLKYAEFVVKCRFWSKPATHSGANLPLIPD
jgi:hypothetical protein